jgi:hypothetical protein
MKRIALLFLLMLGWSPLHADDGGDWSGWVSAEYRYFNHDPLEPQQEINYWSLATQPEYYRSWDGGDASFTFTPFVRWDQHDSERSYADIRELHGFWYLDDWQLVAGISRVFWGVTESVHLVDIINQTASLEGVDGEEKLGQPMIHGTLSRDWGDLDLFMLFGFRSGSSPVKRVVFVHPYSWILITPSMSPVGKTGILITRHAGVGVLISGMSGFHTSSVLREIRGWSLASTRMATRC